MSKSLNEVKVGKVNLEKCEFFTILKFCISGGDGFINKNKV